MNRDEVEKKTTEGIDELIAALEAGKSETLIKYLEMVARFHQYSFGNCMLFYLQFPMATHVAGFTKWKKLGRSVKKGELGIAILAPVLIKAKKGETDDNEKMDTKSDRKSKALGGFRIVYVFDVSQTEGNDLPDLFQMSGDPGELLGKLESVTRSLGITLTYDNILGGAYGLSTDGAIVVRPDMSKAMTFSVLCHEVAHELLHKKERRKETTKAIRELEAEAVSFIVSKAIGLDGGTRSSDYIQLWSGDKEMLMESLDMVQKTASQLIQELEMAATEIVLPTTESGFPSQIEATAAPAYCDSVPIPPHCTASVG